jgi:hypothetical protein
MTERQVVPARKGKAVRLAKGQHLKCINTYGTQVLDMWAFDAHDLGDLMSMHHTHSCLKRLVPRAGESFFTYTRRPILTVIEDHSPGFHDSTYPACDKYRYARDGFQGYHDSCGDNFASAIREFGIDAPRFTPQPFNLWQNCPVAADGTIGFEPVAAKPGDYMLLKAEMDCIVAMSACPYDLDAIPVNAGGVVRDVHFEVS